ncbi:glycosyltransferase [Salinimicrobium sp. CAU 1759]
MNLKKKKNLRIGVIVDSFPQVSETFIVNQINDLLDKGHTVKIFSRRYGDQQVLHGSIKRNKLPEKVHYYSQPEASLPEKYFTLLKYVLLNIGYINPLQLFNLFNIRKFGRKGLNLNYFIRYWWILKEGKFDVFHAHFGHNGNYLAELKSLGLIKNTKLITSFHGYDIHPELVDKYKISYAKLIRYGDQFICNTPYTATLLKQLFPPNKITVLPVGLDFRLFRRFKGKEKSENFTILFVGRLIELKGPDLMIKIFNKLLLSGINNVYLEIIGEGEMRPCLEKLIKTKQLNNKINLLGSLTQEEVRNHMESADILVLPGIYDKSGRAETQGLVIQEAQAMELPVIVSTAGGMKFGLIDGETGYVVEEGNIEKYVTKIEELIIDEDKRLKMGKKGSEFVKGEFDSEKLGDQLEKLYFQLVYAKNS